MFEHGQCLLMRFNLFFAPTVSSCFLTTRCVSSTQYVLLITYHHYHENKRVSGSLFKMVKYFVLLDDRYNMHKCKTQNTACSIDKNHIMLILYV